LGELIIGRETTIFFGAATTALWPGPNIICVGGLLPVMPIGIITLLISC